MAQTSTELTCISTLLTELQVSFTTRVLLCYNQSVVSIAHSLVFDNHTKHMEIDVFFVLEKIMAKKLFIYHIPALDQWVDALTKPLSSTRFAFTNGKLNVKSFSFETFSP